MAKSVQQKLQVLSSWEEEKNISIWKDRGLLFDRLLIGIFMKTWNEELCRRRSLGGSSPFGGDLYQALPPSFFLWKSEEFSSKSIDWDGGPEYPIKVIVYYKTKVLKTMEASETIELIFFFRCSLLLFSWYAQVTEHLVTYLIRIFCMVREVRRRCLSLASWDRFADKYKHILLDRHARRNCSGKVLETLTCLARSKTFCQKAYRLTQSRKVGGQLLRARGYPYEIKTRPTSFDSTLAQFCFENTK